MKSKVRSSFSWFLSILLVLTMMPAMALTAYATDTAEAITWTKVNNANPVYGYAGEGAGTLSATFNTDESITSCTFNWYSSTTTPVDTTGEPVRAQAVTVADGSATDTWSVPTGLSAGNTYFLYTVTYEGIAGDPVAPTNPVTVTVDKKTVTLGDWSITEGWTYDANTSKPVPTVTVTDPASGVTVDDYTYTKDSQPFGDTNITDAGEYEATATSLSDDDNYQLPNDTTVSTTFTVTPADITLSWGDDPVTEFTYNGSGQAPTVTATGGDVTVTYTGGNSYDSTTKPTNASDNAYTATVTPADGNHQIASTSTATKTFNINPIALGVTWALDGGDNGTLTVDPKDPSKYYITYDGEEHQNPTATVTGVLSADNNYVAGYDGAWTWSDGTLTAAGDSKTATAPTLGEGTSGDRSGNYTFADSPYTFTVAIPVTITATDQEIDAGGAIKSTAWEITSGSLADGHSFSGLVVVPDSARDVDTSVAGTYTGGLIFQSGWDIVDGTQSVKAQYFVTEVAGDLTVTATTPSSGGGRTSGGGGGGLPATTPTTTPTETPATTPTEVVNPTPSNSGTSTVGGFKDVKANAYYAAAVAWAVGAGITNGTGADTFSPEEVCTRGQIVTFIWRAAGSPEPTGTVNPFTDVKEGAYYYKAVLWAVEKGVATGTSATTFDPDKTVTRGEAVTFLYRAKGESLATAGSYFSDVDPDAFYADAVAWAAANGVTTGTSATTFSPNEKCTRGQIVTFQYRAE